MVKSMNIHGFPARGECSAEVTEGQNILQDELARQVEGLLPNWSDLIKMEMQNPYKK